MNTGLSLDIYFLSTNSTKYEYLKTGSSEQLLCSDDIAARVQESNGPHRWREGVESLFLGVITWLFKKRNAVFAVRIRIFNVSLLNA